MGRCQDMTPNPWETAFRGPTPGHENSYQKTTLADPSFGQFASHRLMIRQLRGYCLGRR